MKPIVEKILCNTKLAAFDRVGPRSEYFVVDATPAPNVGRLSAVPCIDGWALVDGREVRCQSFHLFLSERSAKELREFLRLTLAKRRELREKQRTKKRGKR